MANINVILLSTNLGLKCLELFGKLFTFLTSNKNTVKRSKHQDKRINGFTKSRIEKSTRNCEQPKKKHSGIEFSVKFSWFSRKGN